MKIKWFFILLSGLLLSCRTIDLIHLSVDKENGYVMMDLGDIHFNCPPESGSIYYQTDEEKVWLKGSPVILRNSESQFTAEWKTDKRTVEIAFANHGIVTTFSFTAQPDSGIIGWGFNLAADKKEYFTGLFERTVDGNQLESWKPGIQPALNMRGQSVKMMINPTLSLYSPFYLSSTGYGVFIEGTWPGRYDFCNKLQDYVQVAFEGPALNGKFYRSTNPSDIVKAHALNIGPSIVPPRWAFLPFRWRDNHDNKSEYYDGTPVNSPFNSMLTEDILMMKALDIPCGNYWIDRPWAKGPIGYDDFEWDEHRFPNTQQMIGWLQSQDIRLLLWIAPWVDGGMAETAKQNHYDLPVRDDTHKKYAEDNQIALIDFSNPDATGWWQNEGIAKMLRQGIRGFKMDRAEELVPECDSVVYANGKTAREMRNAYPVLFTKAAYDICKKFHGDDFLLMPRAGYTGSSRYSAFWGGDIGSPPEGLRCAIIAAQKSAVIGYPLWGSDIGGYWQGNLDREITARWLAFGCFNPIMEFGPTEDRAPWSMKSEPKYDEELIATWRLYATLHAKLADYSLKLAEEANRTGMPPIRPLFLEYPKQEKAWQDWQTFTYGPDILISAIWSQGKTSHVCYLPAGVKWRDAWEPDTIYEGGREIEIETPIYKIPIFIRADSELQLGDLNRLYKESLNLAANKPDLQALESRIP